MTRSRISGPPTALARNARRRRRARTWRLGLIVLLLASAAPHAPVIADDASEPPSATDPVAAAEALGLSCFTREAADGEEGTFTYARCDGKISSWDGVPLDVSITLPTDTAGPLPSVLLMHGWGGQKYNMDDICGPRIDCEPHWRIVNRWNNVWFALRGYATITHTARGFKKSCGILQTDLACVDGHTHLASRDVEIADAQHLLSLAVDARIAAADRLAATGESYGGGQVWQLATSLPWKSPRGTELQLAAAAPYISWTDLHSSLLPNGRAGDGSQEHTPHAEPIGVLKEGYLAAFYALGRVAEARYNTDRTDLGSFFEGAVAHWQAGEPYDADHGRALAKAWEHKSAYYADDYVAAVASREIRPVPIMAVSGWTDPLFPAVESVQMYRKLKAASPDYPIWMTLADIGHGASGQGTVQDFVTINGRTNEFLDAFIGRGDGEAPEHRILSLPASCSPGTEPVIAPSWDHAARGLVTLTDDTRQQTAWAGADPARQLPTDPVLGSQLKVRTTCDNADRDAAAARWSWSVGADAGGPFTLIGLPTVTLGYELTGTDATVIAKVWAVDPDGVRRLVTRGVYRLSPAAGDPAAGNVSFQLFGNHSQFAAGQTLELEISQADVGYLRPNNLPSALAITSVDLTLPTTEKQR